MVRLALLFIFVMASGCTFNASVEDISVNNVSAGQFIKPIQYEYVQSTDYMFKWSGFNFSEIKVSDPLPTDLYLVSVFEGIGCSGQPVQSFRHPENQFYYADLLTEGKIVSLGVQFVHGRGKIGPLQCSPPIRKDSVAPTVDLAIQEVSPTSSLSLNISGHCEELQEWKKGSPLRLCVAADCSELGNYTHALKCENGSYQKTVSVPGGAYEISVRGEDQAGNITITSVSNYVVDQQKPVISAYTSHTQDSLAGSTSFRFSWSAADVGLAGLDPDETYDFSLYEGANCSGTLVKQEVLITNYYDANNLTDSSVYSVRVQAKDAAGNLSSALCSKSISISTAVPTLSLRDTTNTILAQQTTYAKTRNISVEIGNDSSAAYWCLSETQSSAPTATICSGTGWVTTKPTSFELSSSQGSKTVYLWIKDAFGNVLSPFVSDTITLDTLAPSPLAITSPSAGTSTQGTNFLISFTCEAGLDVVITGDVTDQTVNCGSSPMSVAVDLSGSGANSSKTVTLTQTDYASNTSTVNRSFIKDTVSPNLTITSPDENARFNGQFTLSGTCETGLNVEISGSGLQSGASVSCVAGSYSASLTFTAGEGSKAVHVAQTDAAGNETEVSRNFFNDVMAPTLSFTSPDATADLNFTLTGTCETGLTVSLSGTGLQSPTTTNCLGGNFSQQVTLTAGVGAKNITAKQTDEAGNEGTASMVVALVEPPSNFEYPLATYYFSQGIAISPLTPSVEGNVESFSGTLPTGLTLNSSTGVISGTPTVLGSGTYTITVTGPAGHTDSFAININVYYGPNLNKDSYTAYPGIPKDFAISGILANDTEYNNQAISFVALGTVTGGSASVVGGNIRFTGTDAAGETATIIYIAKNEDGHESEGTIEVLLLEIPPPKANADSFDLVQASTLSIHRTELLANDTTLAGTNPLTVVSVSSPVGGTVSYNSSTGYIEFVSTGFTGDAAGFSYTIEHAFGLQDTATVSINIKQLPAIDALVYGAGDESELNVMLAGYEPPTMSEVMDHWGRFAGADWFPSGTTPTGEAASWVLLLNPVRISCTVNSSNYTGFVSLEKLDHYNHEAVLTSTNADDDLITLVLAFVREGADNYTLSAVRSQGGVAPANGWGIVLRKNNTVVASYGNISVGGVFKNPDLTGWSGRMSKVRAERIGDKFNVYASPWGMSTSELTLDPASKITLDLNSSPELARFKGPQSYGYGSYSQPHSTYYDVSIVGGLDPQYIYDLKNNRVYEYTTEHGYVMIPGVDPYEQLGYPREVTNPETGKTYFLARNKTYSLIP